LKVARLQHYIDQYKKFLLSQVHLEEAYKWEALANFKANWNVESNDLGLVYKNSLKSKVSGQLWGGEVDSPKSAMIQLIETDEAFMRSCFRDLFEESRDILLRMDRFGFHCNQLMDRLQKNYPKTVFHYHNDYKILSVYLAFNDPMAYTIYDAKHFQKMAEKLETKTPFQSFEIVRFFKLCKTIHQFLLKDAALIEIHQNLISGDEYDHENSLLLVHDFYWSCVQHNL